MIVLSLVLVSAALGGMAFFAGVLAPTVFQVLPAEAAGPFLRALFPRYYLAFGVLTALAASAAFAGGAIGTAVALLLVALGFAVARQALTPRINALRDRSLAGDAAAGRSFHGLHRASVALNGAQMAVLLGAAIVLAR